MTNQESFFLTGLTDKKILLAEDSMINQEIACEFLKDVNIELYIAENGQQAFDMFNQYPEKYALILMDVCMPILNGYEATQKIRALDAGKNIPIIAMTANSAQKDIDQALATGMNDYITKPIDANAPHKKITFWIKNPKQNTTEKNWKDNTTKVIQKH